MILSDDAFARLVAEDVKNHADPNQKSYLRAEDVIDRWREALYALLSNLDGQLAGIDDSETRDVEHLKGLPKADRKVFETHESYSHQRSKIQRFKFHVEQRLAEADRLVVLNGSSKHVSVESFLRKAIEMHKEMMQTHDFSPTPIDEALWAAVKGQWAFGDIDPDDLEDLEE